MAPDPYRVLGLPADASIAEVKRAYRRLAKANHPDSAGEAALPRFLEIQRAYESITTVAWRPGMRRPAAATASEPWRADPARARTARGASAGAGPASAAGRERGAGAAGAAGAGASPGARRARAGEGTGPGGRGRAAPGSGAGTAGGDTAGSGAGTGRRRSTKKATFGSTTYDDAREQADTAWSGASWYGPTSGEYWRVNPREYADPRKHGPEYLAKAAARAAAAAERRARQADAASSGRQDGAADEATTAPPSRRAGAGPSSRATTPPRPTPRPRPAPPRDRAWASSEPGTPAGTPAGPPPPESAGPDPAFGDRPFGIVLTPRLRRVVRALLAWPPIGIAAAAVIGEATGCASFEATCTPTAELYPWVAQAVIVLALLALPAVARILAAGTIAVALLAFPVAAALSAGGATYDRTRGPAALIAVLAIVWVAGVAAVLVRRAVTRAIP